MQVKVVNKSSNQLPAYSTENSAGMDVRADVDIPMVIAPNTYKLIPTGLFMEIPNGYECQVRPRSGLAVKYGITVLNSPGTIDADYRGEIKICLINHGEKDFIVANGDRIAQLVFAKVEQATFETVDNLEDSTRGKGGFGSTGIK